MTEAPVQLAKQLAKQLAEQSKDASVLARIVALSASDDAFLATPKDSNFNAAWPSDYFNLEDAAFTEAFLGLISAARDVDPRLQKRSDRLVPKKTDEPGCAAPPCRTPHRTRTRTAPDRQGCSTRHRRRSPLLSRALGRFWRCYFGHLLAVLRGTELEQTEPAAERNFSSGAEVGSELSNPNPKVRVS